MERSDLTPNPFAYPDEPHRRRHGPAGYESYERYRPWLEDDFCFRCVYCLNRMVWAPTNTWVIDHLVPQSEAPQLECDYDNLLLACQFCNGQKGPCRVPDPCRVAYGKCLTVSANGTVTAHGRHGRRLVETLRLNHPRMIAERAKNLRLLHVLAQHDRAEFERHMGFPATLPDLRRLRVPVNQRPDGIAASWLARRERGELPRVY